MASSDSSNNIGIEFKLEPTEYTCFPDKIRGINITDQQESRLNSHEELQQNIFRKTMKQHVEGVETVKWEETFQLLIDNLQTDKIVQPLTSRRLCGLANLLLKKAFGEVLRKIELKERCKGKGYNLKKKENDRYRRRQRRLSRRIEIVEKVIEKDLNVESLESVVKTANDNQDGINSPVRNEEMEHLEWTAGKAIEEAMSEAVIKKCSKCAKSFVREGKWNLLQCYCKAWTCFDCGRALEKNRKLCSCKFVCPRNVRNKSLSKTAASAAKMKLRAMFPALQFKYDPKRKAAKKCIQTEDE